MNNKTKTSFILARAKPAAHKDLQTCAHAAFMLRRMALKALVLVCITLNAGLAAEKPNVVIIYGDDVGYGDVGIYGSRKIPTPNLVAIGVTGRPKTS